MSPAKEDRATAAHPRDAHPTRDAPTPRDAPAHRDTPATRDSQALRDAQDQFVTVWGRMASAWGISRTMAEVHALLYITGSPLNTDDIMRRLQISRGNASMSLRSLVEWGIVERSHKRGDRKEYFHAEQDVWAMFRAIVRERVKREIDPLLASLHEIRDAARSTDPPKPRARPAPEPHAIDAHHQRVDALLTFFEILQSLSQHFASPAGAGLQAATTALNGTLASHAPPRPADKPAKGAGA